ncbi:MAG: SDR family oxidoreductase [Alphaproteobacteria bacterium]|nr:SDR family oxidoreductase [Alphaproteobacteria bacterium]
MDQGYAMICGAGPGLGAALVRRFRAGGYRVAALARNEANLRERFADDAGIDCFAADATDATSLAQAFARAHAAGGAPAVAVANSAAWKLSPFVETSAQDFEHVWRASCLSAFNVAQEAAKLMLPAGKGAIIFTGSTAQMRAGSNFAAMAAAKSALRALSQSIARELGPKGIHVAHVAIDGPIDSARTRAANASHERLIDPAGIADVYFALAHQPRAAWSNEIDVRTFSEWPA